MIHIEIFEFAEDVLGVFDECGALPEQLVTAAGLRIMDGPGDGKDLATLLAGVTCGVQRAAARSRLDDQHAEGKTTDEAISLHEMTGERRAAGRKFAHQRAARQDPLGERCMLLGINLVETRTADGDGDTLRRECTSVTRGVDTGGQTTGDGKTEAREVKSEVARGPRAVDGRVATAHHRELRGTQGVDGAAYEEHRRSAGDGAQGRWVGGLVGADEVDGVLLQRGEIAGVARGIEARERALAGQRETVPGERGGIEPGECKRRVQLCGERTPACGIEGRDTGEQGVIGTGHGPESLPSPSGRATPRKPWNPTDILLVNELPFRQGPVPMALLEILEFPDPRLRTRAAPVTRFDAALGQLIDDMFETMYAAPGIGLAASQVNVHQQLIVMDCGGERREPLVFINPEVLARDQVGVMEEGCLSVPGIFDEVERAQRVRVRALDREGKPFEVELEGLPAVCLQHEMDHLDGKLFVDYLSMLKRDRIRRKLDKDRRDRAAKPSGGKVPATAALER